ncbi:MAG: hypothetical protein M1814_002438 [Vezdaea aestivalis]|nr:MAG: hypothetical protein M1814_002438 [Vezdaea aestivalis]
MIYVKFVAQRVSRYAAALFAPAIIVLFILAVYNFNSHPAAVHAPKWDTAHVQRDQELVIAAVRAHNTTWVQRELPEWGYAIYVADNPKAEGGVPKHKGREAMVYLTYIIDNYYNLPNLMVFLHGRRWQWHNDDPDWGKTVFATFRVGQGLIPHADTVATIKRLQLPYVRETGYVNLRCHWESNACPASIHTNPSERPELEEGQSKNDAEAYYAEVWKEMFPTDPLPQVVGQTCCAQFAVTKERVQRRKLEEYERIRNWLLHTPIRDSISGRILEYSWHSKFSNLRKRICMV